MGERNTLALKNLTPHSSLSPLLPHPPLHRWQKLEESLKFQQFCVGVDEEEAWLNEKTTLVSSEDTGDTLAAVQVRSQDKVIQ